MSIPTALPCIYGRERNHSQAVERDQNERDDMAKPDARPSAKT